MCDVYTVLFCLRKQAQEACVAPRGPGVSGGGGSCEHYRVGPLVCRVPVTGQPLPRHAPGGHRVFGHHQPLPTAQCCGCDPHGLLDPFCTGNVCHWRSVAGVKAKPPVEYWWTEQAELVNYFSIWIPYRKSLGFLVIFLSQNL